jgi:hypothetical protein
MYLESRRAIATVNCNHPRATIDHCERLGTGGLKSRPHRLRFFPGKKSKRAVIGVDVPRESRLRAAPRT